jgi:hypothetical protein
VLNGKEKWVIVKKLKNQTTTNMNPKDTIKLDVPLFIRLLEYAREDAKDDMDLHRVAENAIDLSRFAGTLGMIDYENIIGPQENIEEIRRMQVRAGIIK